MHSLPFDIYPSLQLEQASSSGEHSMQYLMRGEALQSEIIKRDEVHTGQWTQEHRIHNAL